MQPSLGLSDGLDGNLVHGYLSRDNLRKAGKDEDWLGRVLREKGAQKKDTLLLTVDAGDHIFWLGKGDVT